MAWENNIFGLVKDADLLNIGQNVTRPNDPIDGLFGDEKTNNIFAKWQTIANEYRLPRMAQFHAFDTESQQTVRVPVDTHNIEKGLIKVKINFCRTYSLRIISIVHKIFLHVSKNKALPYTLYL